MIGITDRHRDARTAERPLLTRQPPAYTFGSPPVGILPDALRDHTPLHDAIHTWNDRVRTA